MVVRPQYRGWGKDQDGHFVVVVSQRNALGDRAFFGGSHSGKGLVGMS